MEEESSPFNDDISFVHISLANDQIDQGLNHELGTPNINIKDQNDINIPPREETKVTPSQVERELTILVEALNNMVVNYLMNKILDEICDGEEVKRQKSILISLILKNEEDLPP